MAASINLDDDLYNKSIIALGTSTVEEMSKLLNPRKILCTENGLSCDWRGLERLINVTGTCMPSLKSSEDPFKNLLEDWYSKNMETATVTHLKLHLEAIDRYDVFEDLKEYIDKDLKFYDQQTLNGVTVRRNLKPDGHLLTIDDRKRYDKGESGPQRYNAFVLYANEDVEFAKLLIDKMEKEMRFKCCIKDRLLSGTLEQDAIINLIKNRCDRLIVIFSTSFYKNAVNQYLVTFGQSLGLKERQRKIIPVLYKDCDIPCEWDMIKKLCFHHPNHLVSFWEQLSNAVLVNEVNANYVSTQENEQPTDQLESTTDNSVNSNEEINQESLKFNSTINLKEYTSDVVNGSEAVINRNETTVNGSLPHIRTKPIQPKTWLEKILSVKNAEPKIADENEPKKSKKKKLWSKSKKRAALAN